MSVVTFDYCGDDISDVEIEWPATTPPVPPSSPPPRAKSPTPPPPSLEFLREEGEERHELLQQRVRKALFGELFKEFPNSVPDWSKSIDQLSEKGCIVKGIECDGIRQFDCHNLRVHLNSRKHLLWEASQPPREDDDDDDDEPPPRKRQLAASAPPPSSSSSTAAAAASTTYSTTYSTTSASMDAAGDLESHN